MSEEAQLIVAQSIVVYVLKVGGCGQATILLDGLDCTDGLSASPCVSSQGTTDYGLLNTNGINRKVSSVPLVT